MAINFNVSNGKSSFIDYDEFQRDAVRMMPNCRNAEIFLLNNFPIDVSTEIGIDFLLVIALENIGGNYLQIKKNNKNVYLHNLIIPVKVITNLEDDSIIFNDEVITVGGEILDFSEELTSMGYGLRSYLASKCKFNKDSLFVNPLVFIKSKSNKIAFRGHLVNENFDFDSLLFYLKECADNIFISYSPWKNAGGYSLITQDIKRIIAQASLDSRNGYITQKKVARITKEISESREIFDDLGKHLVIIEGKAGTGKTSEMLLLMMKCIDSGQNTLFLTFNKLLVYDISRTINSYRKQRANNSHHRSGEHSVINIHRYIHKLSRSIGLLHLMSESRILEVSKILEDRVALIKDFIEDFVSKRGTLTIDYRIINTIKTAYQNSGFDRGKIEVGIDLLNYMNKYNLFNIEEIDLTVKNFVVYKSELLSKLEGDKIFLADYYNVLRDTLLAIRSPSEYFKKYNVASKFDLLSTLMKIQDRPFDDESITEKEFFKKLNDRFVMRRKRRVVFVDEAQDCHPFEREILLSIFQPKNVVVSSGGYEQMIRHVELCNWNIFNNKTLIGRPYKRRTKSKNNIIEEEAAQYNIFSAADLPQQYEIEENSLIAKEVVWYKKGRRSYRIKESILNFCNYMAEACDIQLGLLTAFDSEDKGEIIFDFRKNVSQELVKSEMDKLLRDSDLKGCTPYEGLLILIDAASKNAENGVGNNLTGTTINEYGNIEQTKTKPKMAWKYADGLFENAQIWDGAIDAKNELELPRPNECRLIYYESCRGLEAWSVACFNLDRFFQNKLNHPDAEKYLLFEERQKAMQKIEIDNETRKMMFAGTWTLMALTRAMDSIYIGIGDEQSELGKIVMNYINTNPKNITVLR